MICWQNFSIVESPNPFEAGAYNFQSISAVRRNRVWLHETTVYPVGVTTNRSCFTRIIGHNSRTIHRFCTKFDARIRLWTPFLCAKFQGDRSTSLRFIAIFASVRKHEEKKTKKENRNFGSSYLGNGWSDFLHIWYVVSPGWRETL